MGVVSAVVKAFTVKYSMPSPASRMGELWHCTPAGRMVGMRGRLHTRPPVARESVKMLAREERG
jgi:hypothetical protein